MFDVVKIYLFPFSFVEFRCNVDFNIKGVEGKLQGEFLKATNVPDGRCRFITFDKNVSTICYFKNGKKQKGPQLRFNYSESSV
jgi:hypothetical protein